MQGRGKTLIILTPAFPANEMEENWIPFQQMLLRSIRKLYPDIKIVALSFIYPGNKASYQWNGITVIPFEGNKYRKIKRPLLWRMIWKKLGEINKELTIDAILSFWCSECALVGSYFARRNSIKHFTWICGQDARKNNKMVKFIRPSANELIAMSDFLVDEFYRNHHVRPAHIIPGGVDVAMYGNENKMRDIDIIGAGSLVTLKRYDIFVDVIAGLKNKMPKVKAVLCGDGGDAVQLKKSISSYSLQQNLELPGMIAPGETINMMQRAKILLHPSSYEGFSMACYEALFAGAHVISFFKTMYQDIPHWHVVKSKEEMQKKAFELLSNAELDHKPVFTYLMDDSATAMMKLFELS